MESKSFKTPFYIAAIGLFASTTLLVSKPITSHADATTRPSITTNTQYDSLSIYQKAVAVFNKDNANVIYTLDNSTSNDTKDGQRDGFNNVSMRNKNQSSDYVNAYTINQMIAQGWIAAKNGNSKNKVPYLTKNKTLGISTTTANNINYNIHQAYNGYKNGQKSALNGNNTEPNSQDLIYLASYYKGYNDTTKTYFSSTYNKTPFGSTDLSDINSYRKLLHMPTIKTSRSHFPKTVYAKHRTGVYTYPQFNYGKTYFVNKGHKFHVYAEVSDGHGNWRYKVGKHAYITTIPGSIGTHYVKPAHHKR